MNKIKFCIFLLLICLSGCSAKTATTTNNITSLNLEFDTFTSDDSVPITNVLLVIDEDPTRRMFVGRYFGAFEKIKDTTNWDVMDDSLANYHGWYAGSGVILSLVKEENEFAVYEKIVDESIDNRKNDFKKVTSIHVDSNNDVKLLEASIDKVETSTIQEHEPVIDFEDEEEINEANWNNHPAIKEIREIYNTIEASIKSNELFITNETKDTDSRFTKDFSIYKDKNQVVKKYIEESGSEDSGYTASYYFDALNKLRFVFLELGATNGTNVEYRLYFDAQENKIWEHETLVKGPGYPFSDADEYLTILDPVKSFGSDIN